MNGSALDALLWVLASPVFVVRGCLHLRRKVQYWEVAYSTSVTCRYCHERISLVGMWRCGCSYTYAGHVLRICPVCRSLPQTVRCIVCGVSRLLPEDV
jgi:hypothetical protein